MVESLKLGWVTFQVLRRTFASLAKEAGMDAKAGADHMANGVDENKTSTRGQAGAQARRCPKSGAVDGDQIQTVC
jgi:hypothetical protein